MLQEKKSAQAKTARRDIATLVEQGKVEKARVKVENSAYFLSLAAPARRLAAVDELYSSYQ